MTYTEFIDITGGDASRAPLVTGGFRAYYDTGTGGIAETAQQIQAARAAGMTVALYDQTPALAQFADGVAQMADVEAEAGTIASVDAAIIARRAIGITTHTVYCSYSSLAAVRASIGDLTGVYFGVADYSWSVVQGQNLLAANPSWGYVQFGDPHSNPLTLVPGTNVDLQYANADINVASDAWIASLGVPVTPPSPPVPVVAPAWPFAASDYLGTPRADVHCHSGYYSSTDNHVVAVWQQRMKDRGWTITVDGDYGPLSASVCKAFQAEKLLKVDGLTGPVTWAASWTAPVTP